MNRNTTPAIRKAEVGKMHLKGFDYCLMRFTFAFFLRNGAYTKSEFENMISQSPFQRWRIEERGLSLYVYLQK